MDFNTIPLNIKTTGAYIEFVPAQSGQPQPPKPNKIIVFGQMLSTGTATPNVPVRILTAAQAQTWFGRGSQLAIMLTALKGVNSLTECWAIGQLDNSASAAATGAALFGGSPTQNDTFGQYIAGTLVQMGVTAGMTAPQMATAWVAIVNGLPDLPVTAVVTTGNTSSVTYTANNKGLPGNDIDIRNTYYPGDYVPAGMTCTVTGMAGGTANPSLTAAIAALGDDWYVHWVNPYTDATSLAALQAELDRRFGPTVQTEGHAYAAMRGSVGTLTAFGTEYNTMEHSIMDAGNMPTSPTVFAATLAGIVAYRVGIDPSLPLSDITVPGVLPPAKAQRRMWTDRQLLLTDGISTYNVDSGGNVLIDRLISLYQTDAAGVPDTSYQSVERIFQLFQWRWLVRVMVAQKFTQKKLATDTTKVPPNSPVITPKIATLEIAALAKSQEGILLQDVDNFIQQLVVQIDADNPGQLDALMPEDFIDQFFVFAGQVQFQ